MREEANASGDAPSHGEPFLERIAPSAAPAAISRHEYLRPERLGAGYPPRTIRTPNTGTIRPVGLAWNFTVTVLFPRSSAAGTAYVSS
jgi:hypothetical protein